MRDSSVQIDDVMNIHHHEAVYVYVCGRASYQSTNDMKIPKTTFHRPFAPASITCLFTSARDMRLPPDSEADAGDDTEVEEEEEEEEEEEGSGVA